MPSKADAHEAGDVSQCTQSLTQATSSGPATPTKGEKGDQAASSPAPFVNPSEKEGVSQSPDPPKSVSLISPGESGNAPSAHSATKPKPKFKERKLGPNGEKKNFYNPPGKVMRHLAQQSYYDNFYGNQGQFYTLKQKYKTQMCKHFVDDGECPLHQYCQFAHGADELRQPNDVSIAFFSNCVLIATSKTFWHNCTWSCPFKLQDHSLQKLDRKRRM